MSVQDPSSDVFFESWYRRHPDPWGFGSDPYELARYDSIVSHVPAGRYRRAFEPGCSIGVLTERLGWRCDTVLATDLSRIAVARARRRCAELGTRVSVVVGGLVPDGPLTDPRFDLVVFSEVGYYLPPGDLAASASQLAELIEPGGRLIAAHWLGESADHQIDGPAVHQVLSRCLASWEHVVHDEVHDAIRFGFVLDVWDQV
jgi:SAM-dependent methyltransferase